MCSTAVGTRSRRERGHRRPGGRPRWPGRGRSPGAPGRSGGAWCSRAADAGRVGPGGRGGGPEREPTSGSSSGWAGSGWPPAARNVERNGVERLDIKEGPGAGQENGGRRHRAETPVRIKGRSGVLGGHRPPESEYPASPGAHLEYISEGKRVPQLQTPSTARDPQPIECDLRSSPSGFLTIRRPSSIPTLSAAVASEPHTGLILRHLPASSCLGSRIS